MTQEQINQQISASTAEQADLLDILIVLAKYKKLLIGLPIIAAIGAAAVTLMLPDGYSANVRLLPPEQNASGAAALLSQLGGMAGAAAGAAGLKSPSDVYVGILQSRTVADKLITQFNLKKAYDTDSQEKARKKLAENTSIVAGKDGLITIVVEDESQKLVAPLANAYVHELVGLSKVLAVSEAGRRRLFFERQLELSKDNLAKAEMTLKRALDTNGVISVDSDSRAIVETVGRLRAQISAKEIQLGAMGAIVTPSNPEYQRAREQINSARAELSKLENGRGAGAALVTGQDGQKQAGLENIKTLRDVKYHQMLYELLAKQYEVARLDEAKDPSIIQVLDAALEPERKIKPRRLLIILAAAFLGGLLAILLIIIANARQKVLTSADGSAQLAQLKMHLFGRKS